MSNLSYSQLSTICLLIIFDSNVFFFVKIVSEKKAKFQASLKWLIWKAYGDSYWPSHLNEPFFEENEVHTRTHNTQALISFLKIFTRLICS